ncbi:HpcH/HpaI aldolase/citrate lyase family protein [Maribacter sp. R77961]|uniref:HpcH/HpaI aldolase/citrate lyase family protein n=1 Tax=Maribacter sp. R77961 TaxID=3093871 RepID=UPI0037C8AB2E
MKSFFFVPGTKLDKLSKIKALGVDEIIIDMEDSVLEAERMALSKVIIDNASKYKENWVRLPLRNLFSEPCNYKFLELFAEKGFRKLVIPKLKSSKEFKKLYKYIAQYPNVSVILLIEHPKLLLQLDKVLNYDSLDIIKGMGIGSHDLLAHIGAKHNKTQLAFPRFLVLYYAKAYHKKSFDIASMNIKNDKAFKEEVINGVESGFDAKFLIHPKQVKWLKECLSANEVELLWAQKIIGSLPKEFQGSEVEPYILDGEIIEKPHIEKARKILGKN